MLKGHGSDLHNYSAKIIADFSSNVWYEGLPEGLSDFLSDKIKNLIHYPSPDAEELSVKIANLHNVNQENILVTNGATEAFYLLAQLYSGVNSFIVYPSFSEYQDASKIFNHNVNFISHLEFDSIEKYSKNSLIWIGNPNNPDGKITSVEFIETICKNNPSCCFIIDEAYVDLSEQCESSIRLISDLENIVIVKSLTKTFTIPGIRLGYIVASSNIIDRLKSIKMPWSVNSLAIEAGNFILSNYESLLPKKEAVAFESIKLQKILAKIPEIKVVQSNCNYFLASISTKTASDLKMYLIDNYGFLIRDASNFVGLDKSYFRIAAQKPELNIKLIEAIKNWIKINV